LKEKYFGKGLWFCEEYQKRSNTKNDKLFSKIIQQSVCYLFFMILLFWFEGDRERERGRGRRWKERGKERGWGKGVKFCALFIKPFSFHWATLQFLLPFYPPILLFLFFRFVYFVLFSIFSVLFCCLFINSSYYFWLFY